MPIETEEELRTHYASVNVRAAQKVLKKLDDHCKAFIAASPFFLLATSNGTDIDVSPKGDPAGSVLVEDDGAALLIADRPGNNRLDGLVNIVNHPWVATIFLIPGVSETLRVNGRASIHAELAIRERVAMNDRLPATVTRLEVDEAYLHCAKALIRSKLWKPESWAQQRPVAPMGEMLRDQIGSDTEFETEAQMMKRYETQLY
ncbi:MAG: MSMEG_1061 family FMN-dependent PPOX-type flavoprotein [Pseudomonadota bacterium]